MKKILSLILLCAIWSCMQAVPSAAALSCASPPPAEEEFNTSALVFEGTALNSNDREAKVNFQVRKMLKGSEGLVKDGILVGNMWMEIEPGLDYLIYGNERDGEWVANICGNSGPIEHDKGAILAVTDHEYGPRMAIIGVVLFAVIVLSGAYFFRSRRNRT